MLLATGNSGANIARRPAPVHNPAMPGLIDIGLNLTHDSFDADRDSVVATAIDAGVERMIVTGSSVTSSVQATELCLAYADVLYATVGVHPHHARELDAHSVAALEELTSNSCVVAIGECGLDYFRNFSPRAEQLHAFETQLELATAVNLPVFLHQRDAHEDMLRILRQRRAGLTGGVAHCFTGDATQLEAYLGLDLYIGITGWICDERRGDALRDAVRSLPLNRLLLETDAPYLLPRDLEPQPKTRRNEPRFLPHIAKRLATILDVSTADIAAASTANAKKLFAL